MKELVSFHQRLAHHAKYFSLCVLFLLGGGVRTATAQDRGNVSAQEYGDPVYRVLDPVAGFLNYNYNHTGIFSGLNSSDYERVRQALGAGTTTAEVSFSAQFTNYNGATSNYYGAYTLSNRTMNFADRKNVVKIATDLVNAAIPYPSTFLQAPVALVFYGSNFDGTVEDISNIRCDGFVEYCYEKNGFRVWRNQSYADNTWSIVSYPDYHNDRPDATRNPEREASPWAQRGAPCATGPTWNLGCSYSSSDTKMNSAAVINMPTYQVTGTAGDGYVDVTVRATDESGIHYIGYKKPGDAEWSYSPTQAQDPTSESYSYKVRVTNSGTFYTFALDNGGNYPPYAQAYTINVVSTYNINCLANPSNGGTTSGCGTKTAGSTATVIATPAADWQFVNWTEGGSPVSTNPIYSFTVTGNRTLVANFKQPTYNINCLANPSNGGTTSGCGTKTAGSTATVIATPAVDWQFVNWTEGGSPVSTNPSYSFTVTGPRTLVANFTQPTYNINCLANPSNGGTTSGCGTKTAGSTATVIATPAADWQFVNWTEGGSPVSTNLSYSFTVTGPRTLVANFTQRTYNINCLANPSNGGTTSGCGTKTAGSTATVIATPAADWQFVNWTEGGSPVSTNPIYSFTVTGNRTLVANFAQPTYNINCLANPSNGGTTSGCGTKTAGSTATVIATPAADWQFVNWTEGGSPVSTNPVYSFTVTGNRTLVANFTQPTYSINCLANPSNGGTTSGCGTKTAGSTATVIATSAAGWQFVNWTEGGSPVSTNPVYSFTVTGNRTLVANFTQPTKILIVTPDPTWDYGTVTVNTNSDKVFALHNTGSSSLTVFSLTLSGSDAEQFSIVSPPSTPLAIAGEGSQSITVRFRPTSDGAKNASFNITNNSDNASPTKTIGLTGTALLVMVTSPNGGENWQIGSSQNISWSASAFIPNVKIEYSSDGRGSWARVVSNTANDGSYIWTIPNPPSTNCYVRVSDAANSSIKDESDAAFTISPRLITVKTPIAGATWMVGTSQKVTWSSTGVSGNVNIKLSTNGDVAFPITLASNTPNDSSQSITVPNNLSSKCRVRVESVSDTSVFGDNPGDFMITAVPTITIMTYPSGLQVTVDSVTYITPKKFQWQPGSSHTIEAISPQNGPTGTRYVFGSWSDGGAKKRTITAPDTSKTYKANFSTEYLLTLKTNPQSFEVGTIQPTPVGIPECVGTPEFPVECFWYSQGTTVSVLATSKAKYKFSGWSGDATGVSNPLTVIMNAPKTVIVNFEKIESPPPPILPTAYTPQPVEAPFWVNINVGDSLNPVSKLFGLSLVLNFTHTEFIEVAKPVSENVILGNFIGKASILLANVDEAAGKVQIGLSRKAARGGVDGSGVVAKVRFVARAGTPIGTQVQFSLSEVKAQDPKDNPIVLSHRSNTVKINNAKIVVWPGDTNNDAKVDQEDVLPIGRYWNSNGHVRANASTIWLGQAVFPWKPIAGTYTDANGDGKVDQSDLLPIGSNWGKSHTTILSFANDGIDQTQLPTSGTIAPVASALEQEPNQVFDIMINVFEVNGLFGVAFEMLSDHPHRLRFLSVSPEVFLGNDVVFISNIDTTSGKLAMGISRKSGQGGVNGNGTIVRLKAKVSAEAKPGETIALTLQRVVANDASGAALSLNSQGGTIIVKEVTSVATRDSDSFTGAHDLAQNYPNPFNPSTKINFTLPRAGEVTLRIYNETGQIVRTLAKRAMDAGAHEVAWNGRNQSGEQMAAGVYLYQILVTNDNGEVMFNETKRMTLLK